MIVGIAIGATVLLGGTIMVAHEFMVILDQVRGTNAEPTPKAAPAQRPRGPLY